jgi:hypothetical protein
MIVYLVEMDFMYTYFAHSDRNINKWYHRMNLYRKKLRINRLKNFTSGLPLYNSTILFNVERRGGNTHEWIMVWLQFCQNLTETAL